MKKRSLILYFLIISGINIQAQEFVKTKKHYFFFSGGGGINSLKYKLSDGDQKGGFGCSLDFGYGHSVTPQFSWQIGIGLKTFKASIVLNRTSQISSVDNEGDAYQLRTYYKDWEEKEKSRFFTIPFRFQHKFTPERNFSFFISGGGELLIPIKAKYDANSGNISTTGYYSNWNVELSDMPQHGFITNNERYKGSFSLKTSYALTGDIGGLIKLSEKMHFFINGYLSYGVNNIHTSSSSREVYEHNSYYDTYNNISASNLTKKISTVAIGIKTGICWH